MRLKLPLRVRRSCFCFFKNFVRSFYLLVAVYAFLLSALTFHNFRTMDDPMEEVGVLDRLAFMFGIHDRKAVVIFHLGLASCSIYSYVFHVRSRDGGFKIESMQDVSVVPGISGKGNVLENTLATMLQKAADQLPALESNLKVFPTHFRKGPKKAKLLIRLDEEALHEVQPSHVLTSIRSLTSDALEIGAFGTVGDDSAGTMDQKLYRYLDWTAARFLSVFEAAPDRGHFVTLDVGDDHTTVTFDAPVFGKDFRCPLIASCDTSNFRLLGKLYRLVNLRIQGLGLYTARHEMLVQNVVETEGKESIAKHVRSPCVNPIVDSVVEWRNESFRVLGLSPGDTEVYKDMDLKIRIGRPVVNRKSCEDFTSNYVRTFLGQEVGDFAKKHLSKKSVRTLGRLSENLAERLLASGEKPCNYSAYVKAIVNTCGNPNADQPFACFDMMFMRALMQQLLLIDLQKETKMFFASSLLGWPLSAALYAFQNEE